MTAFATRPSRPPTSTPSLFPISCKPPALSPMSTHRIQPTTFLAIFHADARCADAAQRPLSIQRLVHPLDFDHIRASTSDSTHTLSTPRFDKINIDTTSDSSGPGTTSPCHFAFPPRHRLQRARARVHPHLAPRYRSSVPSFASSQPENSEEPPPALPLNTTPIASSSQVVQEHTWHITANSARTRWPTLRRRRSASTITAAAAAPKMFAVHTLKPPTTLTTTPMATSPLLPNYRQVTRRTRRTTTPRRLTTTTLSTRPS